MNAKVRTIIMEVISALFILLFVYAAFSKLQDFEKFRVELGKSPLLNAFAGLTAVLVPLVELVIVVLLMLKRFQYIALYAAFSLMMLFCAYIVAILKFSDYIPCSCGGILQNMTWRQHLYFNMGFVLLGALAVLIYPVKNKELTDQIRGDAAALEQGAIDLNE